jgi:hypothetical protein
MLRWMDVLAPHPVLEVQPTQGGAQGRADPGHRERDAAVLEVVEERAESLGTGDVHVDHSFGVQHHPPHRGAWLVHQADDLVAEHVGVGEEQRGVEPVDQQSGQSLQSAVALVAGPPGLVSGDPAEDGGRRKEGAPEDLEQ